MLRPGFQKLTFDCYDDRIDIVLVKTISCFARNTVDLFETVSRLKGHEPIIKEEKFEQVQAEMKCRCNIEIVKGKSRRKRTHYSAKSEKQ